MRLVPPTRSRQRPGVVILSRRNLHPLRLHDPPLANTIHIGNFAVRVHRRIVPVVSLPSLTELTVQQKTHGLLIS